MLVAHTAIENLFVHEFVPEPAAAVESRHERRPVVGRFLDELLVIIILLLIIIIDYYNSDDYLLDAFLDRLVLVRAVESFAASRLRNCVTYVHPLNGPLLHDFFLRPAVRQIARTFHVSGVIGFAVVV